ncbi:acyl-[acyl-carrier-protein] desaturase [Kitasatospora sp. MAA4]|uniref:acyl-ACP desaturase n=1 Tax=Kitasatospora sp. MAA4 TaxID=3035093 RepID=UPI0024758EFB|nr:acyl-ACP desaturase [Kitasatospora sp. MAA4]MDH6137169.1 acyl-[acyl-carrier-protein] desaturase [Kitasatospora sp. MAA4]
MSRALREAFHREYMTFFERAERTRRWNLFTDIPWDELPASAPNEQLAQCAETFCGVEMFLPDYLSAHLDAVGGNYGQAWFAANWGYEESKHSLVLREYLHRSGQRTEQQLFDFADDVLARTWTRPYAEGRQMVVYGAIQELTTFVIYRKQRELALRAGDHVLAEIYRLIGRDEMAHARFYQRMIELHLDTDRPGTLLDLAHVLRTFRMPAEDVLPDYEARIAVMRTAGIDSGVFLREVVFPSLGAVGLTRHDLPGPRERAAVDSELRHRKAAVT